MPRRFVLYVKRNAYMLWIALISPSAGWLSKLAVLVGVGYLFIPLDLIPDRTPYIGHLDETTFVLGGFIAGRLLAPATFVVTPTAEGVAAADPAGPDLVFDRVLAASFSWWVGLRRRPRRLVRRFARGRSYSAAQRYSNGPLLFRMLGYRRYWQIHSPFVHTASRSAELIIIGGAARSGTTLLRTILGRHPLIASGPETTVFLSRVSSPEDIGARLGWDAHQIERWLHQSRSQAEFIKRVQREMRERSGRPLWAEKTPANVRRLRFIRKNFPDAKLVHIVRDGRDVVCSLRQKPFAKLDNVPRDSVAAAARCGAMWRRDVLAGLRQDHDPLYYQLHYERLVQAPEEQLRALISFLGVRWDDSLLRPTGEGKEEDEILAASDIRTASIGRWRAELSEPQIRSLRQLIGPLLIDLGYEQNLKW
jgi:protein-tyrosine sulfotransferase